MNGYRAGKVHLTGLRMLSPHLSYEGHRALLEEAAGKSKREIEELIAGIAPKAPVAASIRKLPAGRTPPSRAGADRGSASAPDGADRELNAEPNGTDPGTFAGPGGAAEGGGPRSAGYP